MNRVAEYYPPKDLSLGGESVAINLRIIQRPSHNYPLPRIIEFPDTITYLRAQGMNLLSGSMYIEFRFAHHWISVIFLFQCFSQCPDSVHIVIEGIAGSGRKLGEVATKAFWLYQYLLTSLSEILSLVRLPWLGTPPQTSRTSQPNCGKPAHKRHSSHSMTSPGVVVILLSITVSPDQHIAGIVLRIG